MRRRQLRAILDHYGWRQRPDGLWQHCNSDYWWFFKLGWFRLKVYCYSHLPPQGLRLIAWRSYRQLHLMRHQPGHSPGIIIGPFHRPKGYANFYYLRRDLIRRARRRNPQATETNEAH